MRALAFLLFLPGIALAAGSPNPTAPAAAAAAPDSLTIFFDSGSASLSPEGVATLDHASQVYRQGNPIVMQVSGATDSTGSATANLRLSEARARSVLRGLIERGIPAERFQLVAKGETEPAVQAPQGTAEPKDRRVDITWR